jgi:hypothetical protein
MALDRAADHAWRTAELALGARLEPLERRVTGPAEWVARTGNPHANPNHIEMSVDQLLAFRPSPSLAGYRTPMPGLFLTGAGTHPGGGVTGIPGRNAAAVVLETLGTRRGRRPAGGSRSSSPVSATPPGPFRRCGTAHEPRPARPAHGAPAIRGMVERTSVPANDTTTPPDTEPNPGS